MSTRRRGVGLVELLVGLVLASLIGTLLIRLLISNSTFTERIGAAREARSAGRSAITLMMSELRMVSANDGLLRADATSMDVRVPFAMGIVCSATTGGSGQVDALFFPVDTIFSAENLGYIGFAIRQADGRYSYSPSSTPGTGSSSACSTAGINTTTVPGGSVRRVSGNVATAVQPGTPILLYRTVRYAFEESDLFDGRTALFRHKLDASENEVTEEEIAGPFDESARFRYFTLNTRTAGDSIPSDLSSVRGIEVYLPGESERTARTRTAPEQTNLFISIFFLNRLD